MTDTATQDRHRTLLHDCYLSGQVSEEQWQQHLKDDPELAKLYGGVGPEPRRFAWHPRAERWFRVIQDEDGTTLFSRALHAEITPSDETYLLNPEFVVQEIVLH